jgi:hypothetical protein
VPVLGALTLLLVLRLKSSAVSDPESKLIDIDPLDTKGVRLCRTKRSGSAESNQLQTRGGAVQKFATEPTTSSTVPDEDQYTGANCRAFAAGAQAGGGVVCHGKRWSGERSTGASLLHKATILWKRGRKRN